MDMYVSQTGDVGVEIYRNSRITSTRMISFSYLLRDEVTIEALGAL